MPVSCQDIITLLESFAPRFLAEEGDNIGLQAGDPAQPVNTVFLSLDLNEDVLKEALSVNGDMLVVHHTPLFSPLKSLRTDWPVGRLVSSLIKAGLALYTAHTNLDAAQGGVNAILAHKLGLSDIDILSVARKEKYYKLAVFVPVAYADQVSQAISAAGAGWIGNYSDCTFRVSGIGTFRPLEGTNPFLGEKGKLEEVNEIRLETIVPENKTANVLQAMRKAHPYEEVAFDLYPLVNEAKKAGPGRIGVLEEKTTLKNFAFMVRDKLGVKNLRYCGQDDWSIEKVAVCGGSGMSLLSHALQAGAQVLVTSDTKYHQAQEAIAHNLAVIDAGHFATEQPVVETLAEYLRQELSDRDVKVITSQISTDPFCFL